MDDVTSAAASVLQGYITEEQYAVARGVSVRTCQRDRQLRQAPPHVAIGRQVFYRVGAVRGWLLTQERTETRSPTTCRAGRGASITGTSPSGRPSGKGRPQPRRDGSSGAS